jgi:hypothetical protein
MTPIQLSLTLEEINTVLEALGQLPYARVYLLVQKIQQQATEHLQAEHVPEAQGPQNGRQAGGVVNTGTTGSTGGRA